jgi:hypothetical protein
MPKPLTREQTEQTNDLLYAKSIRISYRLDITRKVSQYMKITPLPAYVGINQSS